MTVAGRIAAGFDGRGSHILVPDHLALASPG